jgi:hypothetical protein
LCLPSSRPVCHANIKSSSPEWKDVRSEDWEGKVCSSRLSDDVDKETY